MDTSTDDFAIPNIKFFPSDPEQFLQFLAGSPTFHSFPLNETPQQATPSSEFSSPTSIVSVSRSTAGTTGSTPSPHVSTSPEALPVSPSPNSSPGYGSSLVHHSKRGRRAGSTTKSSGGRKRCEGTTMRTAGESLSNSDGESEPGHDGLDSIGLLRREEVRRHRLKSEQRRRNDLRGGFACLKQALPVTYQKSSKMDVLDRAATHLHYLEARLWQREDELVAFGSEVARLQQINEVVALAARSESPRSAT